MTDKSHNGAIFLQLNNNNNNIKRTTVALAILDV